MPFFLNQALSINSSIAIIEDKKTYTYSEIYHAALDLATVLLENKNDLNESPVCFMVEPSFDYVKTQWAIWLAGGIAVPISTSYPAQSIAYVLDDTNAEMIISEDAFIKLLDPLSLERNISLKALSSLRSNQKNKALPTLNPERKAMILYTSGTTSLPKGVVSTHKNIDFQVKTLLEAWAWSSQDSILCFLPLHHIHGIINVVSCSLAAGAKLYFIPKFSAEIVFEYLLKGKLTVFMAVPTIYFKLIAHYDTLGLQEQQAISAALNKLRLMVSGSAALPVSTLERWKEISGHVLLERYGMTEIGMGVSNPYRGERRAGFIGQPLPGVQLRLANENNEEIQASESGEIQIKGENVFLAYWNKPEATAKAFTADKWFKTGDIAQWEAGYLKILGRDSVDIIKSGGYKISALEIEEVLRVHASVTDCSVLGIPDPEWGEKVVAVIQTENQELESTQINAWLRERIPAYKVPRMYKVLKELPRNAMGKVVKTELKPLFL
jgi:malonyl-CoA/methylmalonyl-CoA synthetase